MAAKLPVGTYSDDTQLRLAVSRSIRADGIFDAEIFAKVETATWANYALGAGRGSKAAAAALTKVESHWNQNIFITRDIDYTRIGGNGAAMRIQPHVWAATDLDNHASLLNAVVRDSICTHGSPVGIVGAAVHALGLAWTLRFGEPPSPDGIRKISSRLDLLPDVIARDEELGGVWVHGWTQSARRSFDEELREAISEAQSVGHRTAQWMVTSKRPMASEYGLLLEELGGFDPATRGSAIVTAWVANAACFLHADPARSLIVAVNTLGSDTDTIASMAGALIGAALGTDAPERVLDHGLIVQEASRMARIAEGRSAGEGSYPDLMTWNLRRPVIDFVGTDPNGELVLAGHGSLSELQDPLVGGRRDAPVLYRWARTPTGQHVFVRHRAEPGPLPVELLPSPSRRPATRDVSQGASDENRFRGAMRPAGRSQRQATPTLFEPDADGYDSQAHVGSSSQLTLDEAVRIAIESEFRADVVGDILLRLSGSETPFDVAAAFSAFIVSSVRGRRS